MTPTTPPPAPQVGGSAAKAQCPAGEPSTSVVITYQSLNATKVSVSGNGGTQEGTPNGSFTVPFDCSKSSDTYTLTATGPGGTGSSIVPVQAVTVSPSPSPGASSGG